MDHDVDAVDETVQVVRLEDVALDVAGALEAIGLRVERPPCHPTDLRDLRRALERP